MAAADYRLMTEATGQRIAAALEALHLATVTGVKGNAEANYRTGDVNITPANIGAVAKSGDTMTGSLSITPPSGEGGEIALDAPGNNAATSGVTIDNYYGTFRIFGIPSKDGTTHTGYGAALTYNPYTGILTSENAAVTVVLSYLCPVNPLGIPYGGTGATTPEQACANIGALAATGVLIPSAAFSIPSSGNSVSYSMAGITANHILTHWNFSSSAENVPPVDLSWTTANGSFTITNNGGTTSETIRPVFELPTNVNITGI